MRWYRQRRPWRRASTASARPTRHSAQDDLVSAVCTLNGTLATIGQLNGQIIALKQTSQSTADLENQRNAAVQTLSNLIDVKTVAQPDGGLSVFTPTGLAMSTNGSTQA